MRNQILVCIFLESYPSKTCLPLGLRSWKAYEKARMLFPNSFLERYNPRSSFSSYITRNSKNPQIVRVKLHRMKHSSLIENVISSALYEEICCDMESKKFCIMIAESINVACTKYLCVAICYYWMHRHDIALNCWAWYLSSMPLAKNCSRKWKNV